MSIRQNYVKDARYFGHSFSEMMEKALPQMKDGILRLSQDEQVLDIGQNQVFENPEIEKLVVVRGREFHPKGTDLFFHKEIYCTEDVRLTEKNTQLRAVYSKKRLMLGNGSKVLRWADAEHAVAVFDHCDLGHNLSSGEQLIVGYDNTFHRLYSPIIRLGQRPEEPDLYMQKRDPKIFRLPVTNDFDDNARYIDDDMVSEKGTVPYTILTKHDLKVLEGIILQGDIHSDGSVRVMENAAVLGNIFAEKDVLLERGTTVLGNVFTQGNIILEEGACVGQPNKISSMIARGNIRFAGKNNVYGYVVSEGGGTVLPNMNAETDAEGKEIKPSYVFPDRILYQETISFKNLEEYKNVDHQGFRGDTHIKLAEIPDGAETIPESQFFGCSGLEKIRFPKSIEVIEAYAFADCENMTVETDLKNLPLTFIGISAFENCRKLDFSSLSENLHTIEGAAFAGCSSLKKLIFSDRAALKKVGDHAFRDCSSLTEVYLPDQTEYIGVSAFLGCTSLKKVSMPEALRNQPGAAELCANCPGVEIVFRETAKQYC
ncbi:MAG: leucine-rich repeat protein [Clostridia bacterium]